MRVRCRPAEIRLLPVLAVTLAAGCGQGSRPEDAPVNAAAPVAPTPVAFDQAEMRLGIDFTYRNGIEAGHRAMPEFLGGGVALLDYDIDGRLDVTFAGGGQFEGQRLTGRATSLYRCEGRRFADRALTAGLAGQDLYSHAICAADYDGDGFRDVLVTGWTGVLLYRNQGDGTFRDVTVAADLKAPRWTSTAVWGDFDRDEHLDLVLVRYVDWSFANHPRCSGRDEQHDVCSPAGFDPLPDSLMLSNADGTFRDATAEWDLRADGKGLGVVAADLDEDGDLDLYVANDTTANFLYRNDGERFTEIGLISGAGYDTVGAPDGSMGTDVGDFDGDGRLDIWVANFEQEAFALYRSVGGLSYLHASEMTGVAAEAGFYVGWGTLFFDLELDGDPDLFVSNGHSNYFPRHSERQQRPLLFENREGVRLTNIAPAAGPYFTAIHDGRGAASGDLDGDGRPDLVISHLNAPAAVLLNRTPAGKSAALRLVGTRSPREPIGATVTVEIGGRRRVFPLRGGGSYLSTDDGVLRIGFGNQDEADGVTVRWPSGAMQTVRGLTAGRAALLIEGQSRLLPVSAGRLRDEEPSAIRGVGEEVHAPNDAARTRSGADLSLKPIRA